MYPHYILYPLFGRACTKVTHHTPSNAFNRLELLWPIGSPTWPWWHLYCGKSTSPQFHFTIFLPLIPQLKHAHHRWEQHRNLWQSIKYRAFHESLIYLALIWNTIHCYILGWYQEPFLHVYRTCKWHHLWSVYINLPVSSPHENRYLLSYTCFIWLNVSYFIDS